VKVGLVERENGTKHGGTNVRRTGDSRNRQGCVQRNKDGSNGSHLTFIFHEIPPDFLRIRVKLRRLLCILEILFPSCRGIQFGLAQSNRLEAFSKPPFTHGGPIPNVNPAFFPGCDLGPPREILPLVTFSFSKLSTV
jgi:hypothetical protein